MIRRALWRPEDDPEYMAEMERAMRSTSWGCVVFIIGMAAAAVGVLLLTYLFVDSRGGLFG